MYHGGKNAFVLEIFAMRDGMKPHWSLDFLEAAFDSFPDLDYCVILLPSSHPPCQLLQHFVVRPCQNGHSNNPQVNKEGRTRGIVSKFLATPNGVTFLTVTPLLRWRFHSRWIWTAHILLFKRNFPSRSPYRSGATGISRWCCMSCTERFSSGRLSVAAPKCEIVIPYKDFWLLCRRSMRPWLTSTSRWILYNLTWIVSSLNATIRCSGSLYCGCYI